MLKQFKRFVYVYGPMSSGKSTISKALVKNFGYIHLETDTILSKIIPNSDYSDKDREIMYRSTFNMAKLLLDNTNKKVLIDGATTNEKYIQILREIGLINRIELSILLKIPSNIAVERFKARLNHPANVIQNPDVIREYANRQFPELPNKIEIDSTKDINEIVGIIRHKLLYN